MISALRRGAAAQSLWLKAAVAKIARSLVFASVVFWCASIHAAEPAARQAESIDFARDVQPLLAAKCLHCHGPDEQEGGLRLDARNIVFSGGLSGPAVVKGEPGKSPLWRRVSGEDDGEQMPLDSDPLSDEELALIRRWIEQGAEWPEGVGAQNVELRKHWAYVPPTRPQPPEVKNRDWVQSPLDAFVLARLEAAGLRPSPPAERAKLLRRVSLDLTGVPPTVEEIDAFLADDSPRAFERAVDSLLASPRYGERWARPWLDLARYADSNGYQADQYRNVWPYRDWVIDAINADMPFDQFTVEQLAGDLLPEATLEQKIASGFHRLTTCNVEAGVDPEENRVNQVIDRVNTTGSVWLGSTIECAQCHNHKYDPFSQRDYYRLFAYFNNTPLEVEGNGVQFNFVGPKMDLPLPREQQERKRELENRLAESERKLEERVAAAAKALPEWEKSLRSEDQSPPQWHVLQPVSFASAGGADHEILDDGSVLVSGRKPKTDVYTVTVNADLKNITGFKLETLTHDSLPGKGPGRHHPERPNFVLHEFSVALAEERGQETGASQATSAELAEAARPVSLHSAQADYSQNNYHVSGAIDGDGDSGWAIHKQFHKPHEATFLTAEPIAVDSGARLVFTLDQHHGEGRTIGRLRLSALTGPPGLERLPEEIAKILKTPANKRNAKQREKLLEHYTRGDAEARRLREQIDKVKKQIESVEPITTLVMVESEPRQTHIFKRGSFLDPGEPVEPGTPRALPPHDSDAPPNRLGLARWIVDPQNPLTARVAVNRWWKEFFGEGLVRTPEDFGAQGEQPTHPELLDWLACELIDSGWSRKAIHKQIVMSAVYRQSSAITPELLERDPYNRLLARGPRLRMPAETLRDHALAASGLLCEEIGGPPVYPPQPPGIWRHVGRNAPKYATDTDEDRYRRGLYTVWRRSAPYPAFTTFDAPDRASCTVDRARTNTPLQALALLNDEAYLEMARALARRMVVDRPGATVAERIEYGFRRCTARRPKPEELSHLRQVYQRELKRLQNDGQAAELLAAKQTPSNIGREEFAAWFLVANILLNLDETITKE